MIGRGVFLNPFAFEHDAKAHSRDELLGLLRLQLDLFDLWNTPELPRKFDPLKRFFKIYVRDFEGAAELRDKLMHAKSTDEVRALLA
jgi:tRNA-dihydrouridine synthase